MPNWYFAFPEEKVRAIFLLAGIDVQRLHRLENKYWPAAYVEERACSPWWLAETEFGNIEIGWRKRVISINWESTGVEVKVLADSEEWITHGPHMVHAYGYAKAVEYVGRLHEVLRRSRIAKEPRDG